jgi:hypothetical protein
MRRVEIGFFVVAVGLLLAGGLAYYLQAIRPWTQYFDEKRAIDRLLRQWWEGHPPPGVDANRWEATWVTAYNGFGNVCFSPNHASLREMHCLKAELEAKIRVPATLASVRWFWDRLAETGPHGKEYITRMTPLLEEAMEEQAGPAAAADLRPRTPVAGGNVP